MSLCGWGVGVSSNKESLLITLMVMINGEVFFEKKAILSQMRYLTVIIAILTKTLLVIHNRFISGR